DGIRDGHVTGVQTCALPIWKHELSSRAAIHRSGNTPVQRRRRSKSDPQRQGTDVDAVALGVRTGIHRLSARTPPSRSAGLLAERSEERRVGKEFGWGGERGW